MAWDLGKWRTSRRNFVPGHSKGSIFYLHKGLEAVFTGDSFASFLGPTGFPMQCHFDRRRQGDVATGLRQGGLCEARLSQPWGDHAAQGKG